MTKTKKSDIFGAIQGGSIATCVKDWAASFNADPRSAVCDLFTFLLSSAGSTGDVEIDALDDPDVLHALLDQRRKVADGYPLKNNTFKKQFTDFWSRFVSTINAKIIYEDDNFLMENLCSFLGALSSSGFRQFRQTGCTASLTIMTCLVQAASSSRSECAKLEQQLEAEKNKGKSQRQSQLDSRVETLNVKINLLDETISSLYDVYD